MRRARSTLLIAALALGSAACGSSGRDFGWLFLDVATTAVVIAAHESARAQAEEEHRERWAQVDRDLARIEASNRAREQSPALMVVMLDESVAFETCPRGHWCEDEESETE